MNNILSYDSVSRLVRGFSLARSADDTDPAFILYYDGDESTATVNINTAVAQTFRLVYGATTTDLDLTNAAYSDFGELQDAVNAIPGMHFHRIGATRAEITCTGGTSNILAVGTTSIKTSAGYVGKFDTSVFLYRTMAVGVEELSAGYGGTTIPAAFRTSTNTTPGISDPIYSNYPPDDGSPKYSPGYGAVLFGGAFVGTHATNTTWNITNCTDLADGDTFIYTDTAATTGVMSVLGSDQIGDGGIVQTGGWIVVKITAGGAITSSTLSLNGGILYSGGI